MTDLILFHHIQGLTDGVHAFAEELRQEGHTVDIPDLFEGRVVDSSDEGFSWVSERGMDTIRARGLAAVKTPGNASFIAACHLAR